MKADCVIFRGTHHHKELSRRNFVSVEMAFMGEIWKWWDQFKWCIFLGGRWCCSSPLSALWPREWDLTSWLLENSFISIPLYSVICCTFKQTQSVFMAFQHEGPILLPVTPLKMHWLQLLWQGADQKAPCNGSNVIEPDCILERQILPTKLLPNLFSVSALQSFYWKPSDFIFIIEGDTPSSLIQKWLFLPWRSNLWLLKSLPSSASKCCRHTVPQISVSRRIKWHHRRFVRRCIPTLCCRTGREEPLEQGKPNQSPIVDNLKGIRKLPVVHFIIWLIVMMYGLKSNLHLQGAAECMSLLSSNSQLPQRDLAGHSDRSQGSLSWPVNRVLW